LLYDIRIRRNRPIRSGYYAALFVLTALSAARIFYALHQAPQPNMGFNMKGLSTFTYLLTEARVVWKYVGLFIWPSGLNLDHDVELSQSLVSPWSTLPAVICLVIVIAGLCWLAWRRGWTAPIWALGFLILLSPSSSVVPVADVMFEHRTYFPLICLVIAVAAVWGRLPPRAFAGTAAVVLAVLLVSAIVRTRTWHDEESLWTDVLAKSPGKARPYLCLASAYSQDQPARSLQLLEKAAGLDPDNPEVQNRLGMTLLLQEEPAAALNHYQRAIALSGESAGAWNNIGLAHSALGQRREAVEDYRRALALEPCLAATRLNLTMLLAFLGNRDAALGAARIPSGCSYSPADALELESFRRTL
jgi:protein O-mannosyl-transferase